VADVYDQLLTQAEVQEQLSIVNGEYVNTKFYTYERAREQKNRKFMNLMNFTK
jgi:hypothetical protein